MKLYRIIITVQDGELLDDCDRLYHGENNFGTIYSECNAEAVIDYLKQWDSLTISDKLTVVDSLIESIYASQEEIKIKWKI